MSKASDKILRFLLEDQVDEGTIVIINGNGQEDDIQQLGNVNNSKPKQPVRDQFTTTRKGRKWHFSVRRNEFGQISDIDVEEA